MKKIYANNKIYEIDSSDPSYAHIVENEQERMERLKRGGYVESEKDIPKLINELCIAKNNAEKLIISSEHFMENIYSCFREFLEQYKDESLDLPTRLKARMNFIILEMALKTQLEFIQINDDFKQIILGYLDDYDQYFFLEESGKLKLESEYANISYQYGQIIGLSDEIIINKGHPKMPSLDNLMMQMCLNGKTLIEVLDSFYLDNDNEINMQCIRDVDGKLIFPKYHMTQYVNLKPRYYDVPSEYKNWMDQYDLYDRNTFVKCCEILMEHYTNIGYSLENEDDVYSIPNYSDFIEKGHDTIEFRTKEESDIYSSLISTQKKY